MRLASLTMFMLQITATAQAQTDSGAVDALILGPTVVISGKRPDSDTAQSIRRDKPEIVDATVAEDIEKLPDSSVGEAIQRLPGVQITRDRGAPGSLTVRGLGQIETTLNGREVFSAGVGRNLDLADIPSELVSSINVYKTSAADHVEGGIGGLIDVQTHRPLDFETPQIHLSMRQVKGSLSDKDRTQFSTLLSNRWSAPGLGEFGALFSLAHQEQAWREDQKSTGQPLVRTDLIAGRSIVVPNGTSETTSVGERQRSGASLSLQWRPNDRLELYAEGHYAEVLNHQNSYQINVLPSSSFVPGSLTLFPGTNDLRSITWTNAPISILSFARDTVDKTRQLALGGSWHHEALTIKADLSHSQSYNDLYFCGPVLSATAPSFSQDLSSQTPSTSVGGIDLNDPNNFQISSIAYRKRPFNGTLNAFRVDSDYLVLGDFIDRVSAGFRYARHQADNGSGLIFGDNSVSGLSANDRPDFFMPNPYGNFISGTNSIGGYLVGNLSSARDAAILRAAMGMSDPLPSSGSPASIWRLDERTMAAYAMASLAAEKMSLDGNFGLRIVHTDTSINSNQSSGSEIASVEETNGYTDFLPSINLRYEAATGLYLRASASKTVTWPNLDQLSPSLTLLPNTITPSLNRGSAGNPGLDPIRSKNLDLAVEKYFNPKTSIYLTAFLKDINGFITTVSSPEIHDGQTYQISRPQNTDSAFIRGVELGYQQRYTFLPGWLSGLGMQANYTYIDSDTSDTGLGNHLPLQNLSKNTVNLIGIYEKDRLSARIAYNWRDRYISSIANISGLGSMPIYVRGYGWLDAALNYRIDRHISIGLQGTNLTNTTRSAYYGTSTHPQSTWQNETEIAATMTVHF